ncbi:MAG: alpha/beta hydrolase [bacterium]|nr:alpha/beta hydrolase [bacterium]
METLLFLCGTSRDAQSYKKLVDSAPKGWRLYFIPPEELISPENSILTEKILQFLEKRNLNKVILAGHSMGGLLAIEFVHKHPDKVKKLFLIDSAGVKTDKSAADFVWDFFRSHFSYWQKKAWEDARSFSRMLHHPLVFRRLAYIGRHTDLREQAQAIRIPTIIFLGEKDDVIPLSLTKTLNGWISGSKLIILKDMDHDWIIHSPEKFWENI